MMIVGPPTLVPLPPVLLYHEPNSITFGQVTEQPGEPPQEEGKKGSFWNTPIEPEGNPFQW
jgi:hypothetical protein